MEEGEARDSKDGVDWLVAGLTVEVVAEWVWLGMDRCIGDTDKAGVDVDDDVIGEVEEDGADGFNKVDGGVVVALTLVIVKLLVGFVVVSSRFI